MSFYVEKVLRNNAQEFTGLYTVSFTQCIIHCFTLGIMQGISYTGVIHVYTFMLMYK